MNVILDTNVFIEALFEGNEDCILILREEHKGEFQLIMSNEMHEELLRIVNKSAKEYNLSNMEILNTQKILSRTILRTEYIKPTTKFKKCSDSDDNMFFSCAIDGNADYIISRDKHVQDLRERKDLLKNKDGKEIKVLYPDEFVMEIKKIKLVASFSNN
jgi:putative PIN family toxin of toxin-antitoxin system